jgi:hypothetical protein
MRRRPLDGSFGIGPCSEARPSRTALSTSRPRRLDLRQLGELARLELGDLDQGAVAQHLERRPIDLARLLVAHQVERA